MPPAERLTCVHACIHVCVCVCAQACMRACMYTVLRAERLPHGDRSCTCTRTRACACACMCTCICPRVRICMQRLTLRREAEQQPRTMIALHHACCPLCEVERRPGRTQPSRRHGHSDARPTCMHACIHARVHVRTQAHVHMAATLMLDPQRCTATSSANRSSVKSRASV